MKQNKLTEEDKNLLIELTEAGYTAKQIGNVLNRTEGII